MVARTLAVFWGAFSLLNLAGEFLRRGFDGNVWWVDLRALPWFNRVILLAAGLAMLAVAVRPPESAWRRRVTQAMVGLLLAFALYNAAEFYVLLARGRFAAAIPVPLSLAVAASLAWVLWWLRLPRPPARAAHAPASDEPAGAAARPWRLPGRPRRFWVWVWPGLAACMVAFALLQILLFGGTDYRRPADAIVVFGAGVTPDGQCSQALFDRVGTACELHRQGLARRIVMSGGPSLYGVHETEAMRDLAIRLGVPPEDILLDPAGVSTRSTVRNTCALFDRLGATHVLAVSQGFHLPRIKMAYQRSGLEVYTVPAQVTQPLEGLPYYVSREVAALWYYYFVPPAL